MVEPQIQHASLTKRAIAFLIDFLLWGAVLGTIVYEYELSTDFDEFIKIFAIMLAIGWLYLTLMEASEKSATAGKLIMGLMVVDENYEPVDFKQAALRNLIKIATFFVFVYFVGYEEPTTKRRTLHDMLSKTYVVMRASLEKVHWQKMTGDSSNLSFKFF